MNDGVPATPSRFAKPLFDYWTVTDGSEFKPLTRREQANAYLKSLINPVLYFKAAASGAIDLSNDKPREWGQGASGYGQRVGNILAQYGIQRTATFGLATLVKEDNRYFGSGKKGVWRRTAYAVAGSFLARREDGKRYPSVSLIGGFAAAAFISRVWQPPSTRSAGDAAVSFGWSIGYNALAAIPKEFLPDLARKISNRRKPKIP